MQTDQDSSTPTQSTEARRPRRWPVILLIVVILLVAGAGIAGYQLYRLRSTDPYKEALAHVQKDPQVIGQLGEPIKEVWLPPSGSVFGLNANLTFKVQGPKGRASVRAEARQIDGKWGLGTLDVTFADQKRISIDTRGEGDAPRFGPTGGAAPKTGAEPPKVSAPAAPGPDIQLDLPDLGSPGK